MTTQSPVLLELFAAQGGATAGYQRAGWDVYAVDIKRTHLFRNPAQGIHVGDAFDVVETLLNDGVVPFHTSEGVRLMGIDDFDAAHGSPPCQFYTRGNAGRVTNWPRWIPRVREMFEAMGKPFVIENVDDARYDMKNPVRLCGCMFGLSTIDTDGVRIHMQRGRLFETSFGFSAPALCDHSQHEWVAGAYGGARRDKYEAKYVRKGGYVPPDKAVVKALMGIEHDMTWEGLFESIPPVYSEHVGTAMRKAL